RKGKLVYIDGSIHYDSWDDKESGQKKYKTEIRADNMKMLDRKGDDEGGSYAGARKPAGASASAAPGEDDEEVPF
ncbi:MAG TPA: single-stranded DNA-binding protein, partial [Thermoanaerobaculia bacterium]